MTRPGAQPATGLGMDPQRPVDQVRRFSHEAMATIFEVHAWHPDARYAAQAAQAAFDLVDRLEHDLSRFRANSDITRVNHLAAGERTRVAPSTLECLVIARHLFHLTGGAFDVSLGTGLLSLACEVEDMTVGMTRTGVRVDLGGIGKGYAVDLMSGVLEEWGLTHVLVHGGFSSVLALSAPPGLDGWPLTFSHPGAPPRVLARLSVKQLALGASGLRKGDHIVDPRTGEPVRGRLAAWAAVPRPASADEGPRAGPRQRPTAITDALATACMLLSVDEIQGLCAQNPGLEAWIVANPDGGAIGNAQMLHFGR
ncbi:MAG: FAD:protein FMN transferase [Vicinamibacteraceae bacterium]|nr:FAD:protein FMN transferase [Vicinamibacteraceae bacterium]